MVLEAPIRIVMVDDHAVVRDGMKSLLELDGFAKVVATAATAEEAVATLRRVTCDVVLLDIGLPRSDGIWCATAIRTVNPSQKILVLSMHSDEDVLRQALDAGVNGYILKSASFDEVKRALADVHAGHLYVEPRLAGLLLTRSQKRPEGEASQMLVKGLSEREREVLALTARGRTNQEIAASLGLSLNTVKAHLKNIYRKCGVSDRVQVVLCAMRLGIVDASEVK
jgi:DNA-binding NarL/FixJ family response regulator